MQTKVCESLDITPTDGKICLNSIPKVISQKFAQNPKLFMEFKNLLSLKKDLAEGKLWTFPQFKQSEMQLVGKEEIAFPDPKYYMIGLNLHIP